MRNPCDILYSEEEAARCWSPDKPVQSSTADSGDYIPDRPSGGSGTGTRTCTGEGDFEFVMSRVKNREAPPLTPTPLWESWVPWGIDTPTPDRPQTLDDADLDGEVQVKEGRVTTDSKRRAIVFSLSTMRHELVERSDLRTQAQPERTKAAPDQDDMSTWNLFPLYGEFRSTCCRTSYLAQQPFKLFRNS
jgi:hypothetical protein